MASKTDEKVGVVGYLALIFAALFFSGLFTNSEGILKALDFQTYLGSYGKICEAAYSSGIVGSGGSGVREGFFQALSKDLPHPGMEPRSPAL